MHGVFWVYLRRRRDFAYAFWSDVFRCIAYISAGLIKIDVQEAVEAGRGERERENFLLHLYRIPHIPQQKYWIIDVRVVS